MMTGPVQEPEYAELIAELREFRDERLQRQPSDRALAGAVEASPTTVGAWLRADRFPQRIDQLRGLVRAVRVQAERAGLAGDPAVAAVLDVQKWERAYQAEARRRAEGTSAAVQAGQGRAVLERMRPGRPLSEVVDPFQLEVHHAIGSPVAGLPVLPAYVTREHDDRLAEVVAQAADGASRIAVLVGGSSTGKTRACWEAFQPLYEREEPWRLWHPLDPTRPDAALAELSGIAPYTVIWLNEAQFYLAPDPLGEQVAAGLRNVLCDPRRAPVLVLATLWPEHWDTLTTRTAADPHAQARELLDGHRIKVPDAFTGAALGALTDAAGTDPRLGEAAEQASDGQVTQYLAGVPVLMSRYEDAAPTTKALIHAAMDARRLGAGPHIPLAWLAEAAPGYLTEAEWNQSSDDWLEQALHYVAKPCNGIPGILTPVKTGIPRNQRNQRTSAPTGPSGGHRARAGQGQKYRLADYLDQHGRHHRVEMIPPIDFWTAAAAWAYPSDLTTLGDAAWARGLYRDAAQLHKHATTLGNPHAAPALVTHLHTLHPTDHNPAQAAAAHVALDDPLAVAWLLEVLGEAGAQEQVTVLLNRDPAAHVALDAPLAVARLLEVLGEVGVQEQVTALAVRAAAHVALDAPLAVARLLEVLGEVGAQEQVTALAVRAAAHVALDAPLAVAWLLKVLGEAGVQEQVTVLLNRDPAAHAALDRPFAVAVLLKGLREVGAQEQVTALAVRAAAHVALDAPFAVARLLEVLWEAGAQEQVTMLLNRDPAAHVGLDAPLAFARLLKGLREARVQEQVTVLLNRDPAAHAALDRPFAVAVLLKGLREVGAQEQVTALAVRAAAHVALDNPSAVAVLLEVLREVGAQEQVTALAVRAAAHVALDDPSDVARLLKVLGEAGAQEQVTVLLNRDPAAHAALDDPFAVARLLKGLREAGAQEQVTALAVRAAAHAALDRSFAVARLLKGLREAGAQEQVTVLAERAAAHAALDDPSDVARLLEVLWEAGAQEQVTALAERLPAAGRFDQFIGIGDHRERFRFGREPDGSVAAPWVWGDLE
ncbi:hypothetical protein AB0918_18815 [Streptomyces sp. NPDC006864]|uniref:hypothetical protein n=1 Tax=Streptomyces sp. NPDC006864 TaxID=3154780 RepID=UPI003456CE50